MSKLFAVYLGGMAPKANTEIHDVVFVTGETIEETYGQLLDKWLGTSVGLHLDSWVELTIIDGYKIELVREPVPAIPKLFFINFGSYRRGKFIEYHENKFIVAETISEAKSRAKKELIEKFDSAVHVDDLYDLDECVQIERLDEYRISLKPTDERCEFLPHNSYHIIPKDIVEEYLIHHPEQNQPGHKRLNKIR